MEKLKICLIGCGRIALSHLNAAKQSDKVEAVALVDSALDRAASYAERYGIQHVFATPEEAAAACNFDAFDICLPNDLHKGMTLRCAALKKHILLEKPMANTAADCAEMIREAEKNGITLMIGQSRRYYPAVMKSRELAGKVYSVSAELYGYLAAPPTPWWKSAEKTGGLMIPLWGNHIFDYILWMFGEMPETVYCETQHLNPAWEGEDEVMAILGFSGGRYANIRMSWNTHLDGGAWNGEGKILSSKDIHYQRLVLSENGTLILEDETGLKHNGVTVVDDHDEVSNFCRQYDELAASVLEHRRPLTDGAVGMRNVLIQEACLKSAAEHRILLREGEDAYV